MNKDTIFVLGTPDFDCAMARLFGCKFRLLHDPSHISLFSTDSLARLCRDIGLKIERIEYPYFDTPYFCDVTDIKSRLEESSFSPPYYGNIVTFSVEALKIFTYIPIRSGSKRIPDKNILKVGNKPLFHWSVDFAKLISDDNYITVSSDSENIYI